MPIHDRNPRCKKCGTKMKLTKLESLWRCKKCNTTTDDYNVWGEKKGGKEDER